MIKIEVEKSKPHQYSIYDYLYAYLWYSLVSNRQRISRKKFLEDIHKDAYKLDNEKHIKLAKRQILVLNLIKKIKTKNTDFQILDIGFKNTMFPD